MKINQLLNEHKKGVKAKIYNRKPKPLVGPEALKSKEKKLPPKTELQKHKKLAVNKTSTKPTPMGEAKRPDRPPPKTDLKVGDDVVADTSKEDYPGGHKSRSGKVTRVGQQGVHIKPDDDGDIEWHPYKIVKKKGVAEGSLNEFAPDGFNGGDDSEEFNPRMAKMAYDEGLVKGVSLADGATTERAMAINHWDSHDGGMYKQHFAKGFIAGRKNKINHDNKQYNLNLKLMKDGSIRHGKQGVSEDSEDIEVRLDGERVPGNINDFDHARNKASKLISYQKGKVAEIYVDGKLKMRLKLNTPHQHFDEASAQEKLHKRHQDIRKKSGLPNPEYYKELKATYDLPDEERQSKTDELKKKYNVKEEKNMKQSETPKPRNFVAKNAKTAGAGKHKDAKKAAKDIRGQKHKNKELAETEMGKIIDYKPGQTATLNTGPGMTTIVDLKKNPTSLTKDPATGKLKLVGPQAQGSPAQQSTQPSTIKAGDSVEIGKTTEDILRLAGLRKG